MIMAKLTREDIEMNLERKYLGKVITITMPDYSLSGKIGRIAVEVQSGEPIVVFTTGTGMQYKSDLNYFIENTIIHGSTHGRAGGG